MTFPPADDGRLEGVHLDLSPPLEESEILRAISAQIVPRVRALADVLEHDEEGRWLDEGVKWLATAAFLEGIRYITVEVMAQAIEGGALPPDTPFNMVAPAAPWDV